ncbi:hypothetical protein ACLUEY_02735 [Vreelandella aquamarina]
MANSNVKTSKAPQIPYSSLNPWLDATQPMLMWWTEQSAHCMKPITSFHMAWLEGFSQAMQAEMEFLQALTESQEKIARCIINTSATPGSELKMANCYQEVIQTLTNANMERLQKAAELTHEFRKSLWEEL